MLVQESKKTPYMQRTPSTCTCGNDQYSESNTDDSVVKRHEFVDAVRSKAIITVTINFNDQKTTCKMVILLEFVLTRILLLNSYNIVASFHYYYYHIKNKSNQQK